MIRVLLILLTAILQQFSHAVLFRQHPAVYTWNDESFRRSTSRGNWLIFFHDSVDQTIVQDIPDSPSDIHLAAMDIRKAPQTMRRFEVRRIPSFLCLRDGTHYYHYSTTPPYTWSAVYEYCSNPPDQDARVFPPPLSLWKEMRIRVQRNAYLQIAILLMVIVLGGFIASICRHFFFLSSSTEETKLKTQWKM